MRKTPFFYLIFPLFLILPLFSFGAFHEALKQNREAEKQEVQQKRDALKQEVQQKRDTLKQEVQQKKDAIKKEIQEKKDIFTKETKEKREILRKEMAVKKEALKDEIKKKRESFKDEAEKRREELKKKLGEKRAERIESFFKKMVEKFENAVDRLNKLADRIDGWLNKAEDNGKDVALFREKLTAAKLKITEVETALDEAKVKYAEAVKEPDFKVAFQKVKEIVRGVSEKVRLAHGALVDVVNSIKGLGGGEAKKDEQKSERMVEITAGGFAPAELKVKVGTMVKFTNRDSELHQPASGVHPTHEICPGFDALKGLAKDESYSFTFNTAKTCPFHDHLNPSIKGTVVVE